MSFCKIDVHTHVLPPLPNLSEKYGDYCRWPSTSGQLKGTWEHLNWDDPCFRDSQTRVEHCDSVDVCIQVLSPMVTLFCYHAKPEHTLDLHQNVNNYISKLVKENPKRHVGLGTVPLQAPDLAVKELRRCVTELGLLGVEIGTGVNDWNLDHEELHIFYEEAERLGACIFVHPAVFGALGGLPWLKKHRLFHSVGTGAESARAIVSLMLGGIFTKFPKLRWCFSHGGGLFPGALGRVDALDNLTGDNQNPRQHLGKFWLDTLTNDADILQSIVKLVGEDKVVLGTDYPLPWDLSAGGMVENMNWTQQTKEKVFWKNAVQFLGINESEYCQRGKHCEIKSKSNL